MKTATVRIYHIFGTKNEFCADVMYRGRLLRYFYGEGPQALCDKARAFAHAQGYTHTKVIFG